VPPYPVRIVSSLRADMIFGKDRWSVGYFYHAHADKWSDADTLLFHVTLAALKFHALPADVFFAAARPVGLHL
jgi:hypothetical protein